MTAKLTEQIRGFTILFLGTGAGDWPQPAGVSDGQVRRRSAILVNQHLLIDCGPTVINGLDTFASDGQQVSDVLLTHTDPGHFSRDALAGLSQRCADDLRLWGHPLALDKVGPLPGVEPRPVAVGEEFSVGDVRVEGLAANHLVEGSDEIPLHFLFLGERSAWLYAPDGAWFLNRTWNRLSEIVLDAMILDATLGDGPEEQGIFAHNNLPMVRLIANAVKVQNMLKPGGQIFLTHFSQQAHVNWDELERKLRRENLVPARDGMTVHIHDVEEEAE